MAHKFSKDGVFPQLVQIATLLEREQISQTLLDYVEAFAKAEQVEKIKRYEYMLGDPSFYGMTAEEIHKQIAYVKSLSMVQLAEEALIQLFYLTRTDENYRQYEEVMHNV